MRCTHLLIALVSCCTATAQSYFQKTYGEHHFGPLSFAASPDAYYLAHENEVFKVDLDGQLIWRREIMFGTVAVTIYRIACLDGALLISGGHLAQQNFLAKLDTSGVLIWANAANYGDINIGTRIHDVGSGYLLAGHREYPTGGGWTFDITMTQWDAAGDFLWGKATGDDFYDFLGWTSLILANGDILVAGNRENPITSQSEPLIARFDTNGDLLWMKILIDATGFFTHLLARDLIATSDGEFALVGTTYNTFFNYDAHVMKLDGDGNVLWARRMFQVGWTESAQAIIEDSQQRLVVGGVNNFNSDPVEGHLARFDLAGNFIDAMTLPHFDSPTAAGYYAGLGQDLVERMGSGYAYAGDCDTSSFGTSWHGIITTGYLQGTTCYGPVDPYPFTVNSYTWADSLIPDPVITTNITEVPVALTSALIAGSSFDVCNAVLSIAAADEGASAISVFPNPTEGSFTCDWTMAAAGPVTISVSDPAGRTSLVLLDGNRPPGRYAEVFDLGGLAPGIYLIRADVSGSRITARLIRQ